MPAVPTLIASDAFLAALVNSSEDAILSKDLKGVVTSWNQGAERIFGYTAAEMIGQPITVLFPPGRVSEEAGILAQIAQGQIVQHYQTVRRRKDGTLIDISLTVSPIRGPDGQIIGASKIARDVTVERRAQERQRVTLSSIGDAVISTNDRGEVVFMNRVAEMLTGWTESEVMHRPLRQIFRIVNETSREEVENPAERVIQMGSTVGLAAYTVLIARDGTERPIDDSAAPIRDEEGGLAGVVLIFRDVTERRQGERAALRLAAIIAGSDDAIVAKNLDGVVTDWNPGAERLFGYTAAEMIGQPITRLLPPERFEEERQILAQLQRGERLDHFETQRVRKDGTAVTVSLTISPIRDREGVIIGASKIARDMTAVREAHEKLRHYATDLEEKVRERTARLEETIAELEAFSYSLSHDMRAPIRAIQGFTEMVLADCGAKIPEGVEYLQRAISAAGRLDRMIRDVLSLTRVTRAEIELSAVKVEQLVRAIVEERPCLQPPQACVSILGQLPPVVGHEVFLTQCIANLLENAVKFVTPGMTPRVEISAFVVGTVVRLNIRDNGIGIDHVGQEDLFALFRRLPTTHPYQGTGVGLAIVQKAVDRMKGRVGVDSAPVAGSTFWIELPLAQNFPPAGGASGRRHLGGVAVHPIPGGAEFD